jgi:nucleotidyltransferase substrate binding protein (TIGR01987 family)
LYWCLEDDSFESLSLQIVFACLAATAGIILGLFGQSQVIKRRRIALPAVCFLLDNETKRAKTLATSSALINSNSAIKVSQDIRWKQRFRNYQRALQSLNEAVTLAQTRPLSNLENQGLIQSFEFTHELAWNVLKDYLVHQGVDGVVGSRDASRLAFKNELIEDGEVWMKMIEARNQTSHTYNPAIAEAVIANIMARFFPSGVFQSMMNYGLSEEHCVKINTVLRGFPQVEKAILYGSRAKGTFKRGSDIDLTLIGPALTFDIMASIAAQLDDLLLPYMIDLSIYDMLEQRDLREHIQRVGLDFYRAPLQETSIPR